MVVPATTAPSMVRLVNIELNLPLARGTRLPGARQELAQDRGQSRGPALSR